MIFQPFGDNALLINFEQVIDIQINQKVIELAQNIDAAQWQEITFLIPAYCSLTVGFNSEKVSYEVLVDKINLLRKNNGSEKKRIPQDDKSTRILKIPVCYDTKFALDIEDVGEQKKLDCNEIITLHTATVYHVFMLGFLPGFPYLGSLKDELVSDRKEAPRMKVPSGSVGIAGNQTGIYPLEAPGGWQIIGRTPIDIFDAKLDNPFLFQVGDSVRFEPITLKRFFEIKEEVMLSKFNIMSLYV